MTVASESRETIKALEKEIEQAHEEKETSDLKNKDEVTHLSNLHDETKAELEMVMRENEELTQRCHALEDKVTGQESHNEQLESKFEQWEKSFTGELEWHKEKI